MLLLLTAVCAHAADNTRVLRIGTSGDYAPFTIRTAPEGSAADAGAEAGVHYSGFDIEVARRFAGDAGYTLEIVPFRWPDLSRDLLAGRFDVAMGGVTVRGDRSVAGTYTVPVAHSHAVALAWKGADIDDIADLNRRTRRIAVNAGGYLEGVARRRFVLATIVAMPNNQAVQMALMDRWTDAVITDSFEEQAWTKTARDFVRIGPLSEDRKAYLVRADRDDLGSELNAWLLAKERDGTLARLRADKLGPGEHTAAAEPLAALVSAVAERMSLMPLVWAAKRQTRKPIEDKEQEARILDAAVESTDKLAKARRLPPPQPELTRRLFKAMMEAGKDIQGRLADEDRLRRRSSETGSEENADADTTSDGAEPLKAPPQSLAERILSRNDSIPLFDLDTQIRPALARLTHKLASLVVALDEPVTVESVQRRLAGALAEHNIQSARIGMIAESIASLAESNADDR